MLRRITAGIVVYGFISAGLSGEGFRNAVDRDPAPVDFRTGWEILSECYCDQPYVVKLGDGSWLCVMTTGKGREGQQGQHVVSTRSLDRGRTWTPLVDVEPADGPEASWAVPLTLSEAGV